MADAAAAASTSKGSAGAGGGRAVPAGGGVAEACAWTKRDCREAHVTLELHDDGLILG